MNTYQRPYELLIRWDQKGQLAGAHVQYRHVIEDESGSIVGDVVGPAKSLTIGEFPLQDILNTAQADALAASEQMRKEITERERMHAEEIQALRQDHADQLEAALQFAASQKN